MCLNPFNQLSNRIELRAPGYTRYVSPPAPGTETRVEARVRAATIVCPTADNHSNVSVLNRNSSRQPRPDRKGKCIGISLSTRGIISGRFILRSAAHTHIYRKLLSDTDTVIIKSRFNLCMIITCQRYFELRIRLCESLPMSFASLPSDVHP